MSDENPPCPVVENEKQAIALGKALAVVWHYDKDWVLRVFNGDPLLTYQTGPDTVNREILARWEDYSTLDERRRIISIYMREMLS